MTTITIYNNTRLRLSRWDALRTLFGAPIHVATEIDVSAEVEALDTRQRAWVERLGKPKATNLAVSIAKEPV